MDTMSEIIPFAKEMLNQKPSRGMVKMYMLGTTLAVIGMVSGLVETVCLPFVDQEPIEEVVTEEVTEKEKLTSQTTVIEPDVVEELQTDIAIKAKSLMVAGRRSSVNRARAC